MSTEQLLAAFKMAAPKFVPENSPVDRRLNRITLSIAKLAVERGSTWEEARDSFMRVTGPITYLIEQR